MNPIIESKREQLILELEHRIAHYKRYRIKLIEEALQLSYSNPRKAFLLKRAQQFAVSISNTEKELYELYAQRSKVDWSSVPKRMSPKEIPNFLNDC